MLHRSAKAIEKWKGFDERIDRWLDERHQLILQLTDFAANHDFRESSPQVEEKLLAFTALVIDYVSAGHFEIYHRLIEEGKEAGDDEAVARAAPMLEAIQVSTEAALAFHQKYEQLSNLSDCASDLSALGEALAVRFNVEDEMIHSLHLDHLRQISA